MIAPAVRPDTMRCWNTSTRTISGTVTTTEAAMIASSLPNPKKYTVKPVSKYVNKRYPWVIQQMTNLKGDPEIELLLK